MNAVGTLNKLRKAQRAHKLEHIGKHEASAYAKLTMARSCKRALMAGAPEATVAERVAALVDAAKFHWLVAKQHRRELQATALHS